jgi:two-component system invasion response regulator UvrY
LKVLIVDDHAIVRQGSIHVLEGEFPEIVIVESASGHGALDTFRQQDFYLVILDISLPDKNGIEVLKEMKILKSAIPVVILSLFSEEQYAIRALKSGASAYLTKETAPEELFSAVNKVLADGKFVSLSQAEQLAGYLAGVSAPSPLDSLSDRELEVLCLIGHGKTVSEIVDKLTVSVKTMSTYRARLLEKLKLKTTPELIRYALEHGLVT